MGIANSVLEAVRVEAARVPGSSPRKVGVRIGTLTALDPSSLQFCFEALTHETDLEGLEMQIEMCPVRRRCGDCGSEFEVKDYELECPRCQSIRGEFISGEELELAYLEVEENGKTAH